ncbi:uncharacterized protein K441DRAFT_669548 [Cenococcum geophilum 1.58]|uniref:Uncharacterized protein n=1 Tax=Cenococcum geophilum 1.58 TaxID=794803 RepID=A0ACC8EP09_9PEZI|nr:hypothetical protein K441DRAFT_669548 [Cenococcum geophilum 1.58]
MVYTGKPSRGCQTCKSRRIKCDEIRPTCTQCRKSGRTCPGYPDEFDLIFRDENAALERRARKASGSKSASESSSRPSPSSSSEHGLESSVILFSDSPRSQYSPETNHQNLVLPSNDSLFQAYVWYLGNAVPPPLTPSAEAQATAFFFRNFVLLPQQAESIASSALHLATHAVSLSALGNYPGRHRLLQDASVSYGQALRKVNLALKDPIESKSDETVLAILMFSLYEAIASRNETVSAWAHHVDGAVALTKVRGAEQFKNPQSYQVFRAVRTMMITSCVQRSKPVEDFPESHGWMGDEHGEENAANRLTLISIDLPNIRAKAKTLLSYQKNASTETEVLGLISYAQTVDTNLGNWANTLPPNWSFRTAGMVYEMPVDLESAEQWPGPQHVYDDVFIANIINDYRVSRIFCQSVVLGCASWLAPEGNDPRTDSSCVTARFVIQQMVDEISASVPFHMSYDMQPMAKKLGQDESAAEALGGYFLVWPLFVAANAETVPKPQQDWLHGRLYHIGREFGLSSAQILVLARRHVLTCGPMFP